MRTSNRNVLGQNALTVVDNLLRQLRISCYTADQAAGCTCRCCSNTTEAAEKGWIEIEWGHGACENFRNIFQIHSQLDLSFHA